MSHLVPIIICAFKVNKCLCSLKCGKEETLSRMLKQLFIQFCLFQKYIIMNQYDFGDSASLLK